MDVMSSTWVFRLVRFDSPLHLRGGQLGLGAPDHSRADRTGLLDLGKKREMHADNLGNRVHKVMFKHVFV